MSSGPIEFASDGPRDEKGPTEYGGTAGLVSDHADAVLEGGDLLGIIVRSKPVIKFDVETKMFVVDEAAPAVDPVSGREAVSEDGSAVAPVDVPLRTGEPRGGVL